MTPSQMFDIISSSVQTVPTPWTATPTLHRGETKSSSGVRYNKGGMVCREYKK
jgi:hypothetical protein